jgi:hypothetical protein
VSDHQRVSEESFQCAIQINVCGFLLEKKNLVQCITSSRPARGRQLIRRTKLMLGVPLTIPMGVLVFLQSLDIR